MSTDFTISISGRGMRDITYNVPHDSVRDAAFWTDFVKQHVPALRSLPVLDFCFRENIYPLITLTVDIYGYSDAANIGGLASCHRRYTVHFYR